MILDAIAQAHHDLERVNDSQARKSARKVLADAREQWPTLGELERRKVSGPASVLRRLLDCGEPAGPAPTPEALLEMFGLDRFRPGQRGALEAALERRDCLVVMPTGAGKSLCYQLMALADRGLVLVISPLIALMADQLRHLQEAGVRATMLASGMEEGHNARALQQVRSGETQLVLVAPERFASQAFRHAISTRRVGLFAVDEAHCLAEWGHDFRPDYLRLRAAIGLVGRPPVMALTATATPRVAHEIAARLGMRDWTHLSFGFDRPNLTFDVLGLEGRGVVDRKRAASLGVLRSGGAQALPAIVYCGTRRDTERVAEWLCANQFKAVAYHAGMDTEQRRSNQAAFMEGAVDVVVATNAFGMGVDKVDVRTVIHWALPASLEEYYQQAGRAGRDGRPARALLLAARVDLGRLVRFNTERQTTVGDVRSYIGWMAHRALDGVLELERGSDRERELLSIAERSGALRLAPGSGGRLRVTLLGRLDSSAAWAAIKAAKDRGWESYRAIERFISCHHVCRRRQILEHFGDPQCGSLTVRCCDVCAPDEELHKVLSAPPAARRSGALDAPSALSARELIAFERLREWRREQAEGKPAYTVLANSALEEIVRRQPRDLDSLRAIRGVGPVFCSRHGSSLLSALSQVS